MNNQYPIVPRTRAFLDPSIRTTNEANNVDTVKEVYRTPSDIVPKFFS